MIASRTTTMLLKDFGIAQSEFCRATGLSRSAISRICTHGQWPVYGADQARKDIEAFLGNKVFLELYVKVRPKWRDSDLFLKEYGY